MNECHGQIDEDVEEEERRIQAFENKCIRKLYRVSWMKMMINNLVYTSVRSRKELLTHTRTQTCGCWLNKRGTNAAPDRRRWAMRANSCCQSLRSDNADATQYFLLLYSSVKRQYYI